MSLSPQMLSALTFTLGLLLMYVINKFTSPSTSKNVLQSQSNASNNTENKKKQIRVYVDGCWDVMHSGHYNALRQAKALGDILVVGVHSDKEIAHHKREPVMNNEQRMAAVTACKWADEVVFDVPYSPSAELVDKLKCDYIAHGDDIPIAANGHSAYHTVMDRLKIFRRTPGVSTTHLIERLVHAVQNSKDDNFKSPSTSASSLNGLNNDTNSGGSWSSFLASSSRISAFSNDRIPKKEDVVIYIDGVFDLFHIGHIAALKKAKEMGTYLYVGLYDDETVRSRKGNYFPLMNLQERVLNVLSCKYVDDVLIGAPWKITKQIIKSLHVKHVITTQNTLFSKNEMYRYDIPKKFKIFKHIETDCKYTTEDLMDRIISQQETLKNQNQKRVKKAKAYVDDHDYVEES